MHPERLAERDHGLHVGEAAIEMRGNHGLDALTRQHLPERIDTYRMRLGGNVDVKRRSADRVPPSQGEASSARADEATAPASTRTAPACARKELGSNVGRGMA